MAVPPAQLAGLGRIEIRLGRTVLGDIDLCLCRVEQRAVLEQVRVDEQYRRHGFGTVLVAAAHARAPRYQWSTTVVRGEQARAFWAAVSPPFPLGEPHWCTHMHIAAGRTPDGQ
ncbi:GNAT family N-acetyltransferase [Amycolatopsis sp. GM8]|uniref:GNAT family N-acetyltransferase n=1 Tax=Amycolatopsis sp. GM8 TaxID=2896530 RepID=UPI001F2B1C84|nr:GNAT family N-acetyltransferase [Amycolatopsis sp. GM8]